ncbi:MAG TPA: pilin [Candidatus Paceibacterota bacterium]
MRRAFFYTPILTALAFTPLLVFAQSSSLFGPIIPQTGVCTCPGSAPNWGCVIKILQNGINVAIAVAIALIVLAIAYAGFVFMTAGANASKRTQGKNILLNSVLGLLIMLAAWIGVDFVMKAIYNPQATFDGQNLGPWNAIWSPRADGSDMCIQETVPVALTSGLLDILTGQPVGSSPSGGGGGGGSCEVPASGPCSVSALSSSCFSSRAQQAARVCNRESGNNPRIPSGTDLLNGGSGPSYSIGLWQINLTVHQVGGLNCPAAFSAKCGREYGTKVGPRDRGWCTARVTNQDLYSRCVEAAKNPQLNTQAACGLYNERGFQPWSLSANRCNVPTR